MDIAQNAGLTVDSDECKGQRSRRRLELRSVSRKRAVEQRWSGSAMSANGASIGAPERAVDHAVASGHLGSDHAAMVMRRQLVGRRCTIIRCPYS